MLALGGGSLPKPEWPIFGFLSSCGWCIQPVSLKTHLYVYIGLIYTCEFLQANMTWPIISKKSLNFENSRVLQSSPEFSRVLKVQRFFADDGGWPGE